MLTPREQFLVDVGIATFARRLEKLAAAGPGVIGLVDAQFGNANSPASTIQLKGRGIPAMAGFAPKAAPSTQGPATPTVAPPMPAAAGKATLNTKTAGAPIWLQGKEIAGTGPKTQKERAQADLAQPQPDLQLPRLGKEAADRSVAAGAAETAVRQGVSGAAALASKPAVVGGARLGQLAEAVSRANAADDHWFPGRAGDRARQDVSAAFGRLLTPLPFGRATASATSAPAAERYLPTTMPRESALSQSRYDRAGRGAPVVRESDISRDRYDRSGKGVPIVHDSPRAQAIWESRVLAH